MPSDPQPQYTAAHVNDPLREFGSWATIIGPESDPQTLDLDNDIRVVGMRIIGGSFTVNSNDEIDTADYGGEVVLNPKGNLQGPTIEFVGVTAFLLEIVTNREIP